VSREQRAIRRQWKAYILILKMLAVTGIFSIGIHVINQLDDIMSDQRTILKTQADCMDQIMWLRQDVDTLLDQAEKVAVRGDLGANTRCGVFDITHYCKCTSCCGKSNGITATGTQAEAGRTIAVDPSVIPLGTEVIIDGQAYIAEDTGGAIKGNRIDIFCDSHQEAINRGKITREIWVTDTKEVQK
jgi:3D (Asp-Asp-Asp) domain-containing protein